MHRHRRIATLLCVLGLWLQMMAPALALSMQRHAAAPGSVICHSGGEGQDHGRTPLRHAPSCDHCLLCHAVAGGLPTDHRPAFTLFDYPASSPVRWTSGVLLVRLAESGRNAQPRGPPAFD